MIMYLEANIVAVNRGLGVRVLDIPCSPNGIGTYGIVVEDSGLGELGKDLVVLDGDINIRDEDDGVGGVGLGEGGEGEMVLLINLGVVSVGAFDELVPCWAIVKLDDNVSGII